MLPTFLTLLGVSFGAIALLLSSIALSAARSTAAWVTANNKRALSLKRMAEVEAELTDLRDAYEALLGSHKKLRARIGMRKVRETRDGAPDSGSDPEAYKAFMRRKLNIFPVGKTDAK